MYIIAEIGVNHNGSLKKALKLIDTAILIGANCVKFQSFKTEKLSLKNTKKVKYQLNDTSSNSHFEMLKRLELSFNDMYKIINYCRKLKIDFLSTPYDIKSAKELKSIGINKFKIASADIVDYQLNKYLSTFAKEVFISTGMANQSEIDRVLRLYKKNTKVNIMHCTSSYPTQDKDVNLLRINSLKKKFKVPCGFSDHSIGDIAAIGALTLGCEILEKHLTLNKKDIGPDHATSMEPGEFKELIKNINRIEVMLGTSKFKKISSEKQMKSIARKSLHWYRSKSVGSKILLEDIISIRPNDGLDPFQITKIIGKKLSKNVIANQPIKINDLEK